nr:hypothetical protein [Methylomarinum sp. Ch1-1]MDP4520790.1 hypothetical protein [Methylomarinum sp. Ch1-1]
MRFLSSAHPTLPAPVGRIKRSGSANVGRLREAAKNRHRRQNWSLWYPGAQQNLNIHPMNVNIFDCNIGEYSGGWIEADQIIDI